MLSVYTSIFGIGMWENTIVVVTHWCFDERSKKKRADTNVSETERSDKINEYLKAEFKLKSEVPIVFLDNFDVREDETEEEQVEQLQILKTFVDQCQYFDVKDIQHVL